MARNRFAFSLSTIAILLCAQCPSLPVRDHQAQHRLGAHSVGHGKLVGRERRVCLNGLPDQALLHVERLKLLLGWCHWSPSRSCQIFQSTLVVSSRRSSICFVTFGLCGFFLPPLMDASIFTASFWTSLANTSRSVLSYFRLIASPPQARASW